MISNLISPFIDDRHVDIIYKNGHFLPSRGAICGPHPLVHIAFYCPLKEKQEKHREKIRQCICDEKETKREGQGGIRQIC